MNKFILFIGFLFVGTVFCQVGESCSTSDGGYGTCIDTDQDNCDGGVIEAGFCQGPSNISCCVTNWGSCSAQGESGECVVTSACNGTSVAGSCPGPSDVQCCVSGGNHNTTGCTSQWTAYSQCDPSWGDNTLGTSGNTICSAGCAMTSVAMILASAGESINGQTVNPGTLNTWLTSNGGYSGGDEIVWNSVASLGGQSLVTDSGSIDINTLENYVNSCNGVVVLVRGGSHWVLITGYVSGTTFSVNDPGFNQPTYDYSDMSDFIVYGPGI